MNSMETAGLSTHYVGRRAHSCRHGARSHPLLGVIMNLHRLFPAALYAAAAGCSSSPTTPPPPPPPPSSPATVVITNGSDTLDALGATLRLQAEVRDSAGQVLTGQSVTWTATDPTVATVTGNGVVRSIANGATLVVAALASLTDTVLIGVSQTPATIALTVPRTTLAGVGDTLTAQAEVRDRLSIRLESQPQVSWSTTDAAVATVDGAGRITATGWGPVQVRAQVDSVLAGRALAAFSVSGGGAVPQLDRAIVGLMGQWGIPGATVGFVKNGQLVSLRGYGVADSATSETMRADHVFRIASISKPITGVVVLKAIEDGLLNLNDLMVDLIPDLVPPGGPADSRVGTITIDHLLHHRTGWNRTVMGDPMFTPLLLQVSSDLGIASPASADSITRWLLNVPLSFDPGAQFSYNNVNYMILGRIIERVTGMTYEQYVTNQVLGPMGVTSASIGRTRRSERAPNEVVYYSGHPGGVSMFGDGLVSAAYGSSFNLPASDSHGGWIISAADLLRFAVAVDGDPVTTEFLSPQSQQFMVQDGGGGYGAGWFLNPGNWVHSGGLPGTSTLLVTYVNPVDRPGLDGFSVAILLNAWPQVPNFGVGFFTALLDQAEAVSSWPTQDLFGQY